MHFLPKGETPTVAASIRQWARTRPHDLAVLFLSDGANESSRLSFAELDNQAQRIAGRIVHAGLIGRPVLLPALSEPTFLLALCGCLYAGAIAVPSPYQLRNRGYERIRSIVKDAAITALIGSPNAPTERFMESIPGISLVSIDGCDIEPATLIESDPQAPALLQYTSGSTSAPKGVVISHHNLIANIAMLGQAFGVNPRSRMLTWLPLFHDMGLIAHVLSALHWGIPCVVMPPLSFIQRPRRWLEAISRYQITISGGPNFAYELCIRRIRSADHHHLDLSSWEVAFCGAEPVRPSTMRNFVLAFAGAGFREGALYPCYGLAEATVFVSGGIVGRGARTLPADAPVARELVSCGFPAKGGPITIVDPESLRPLPDGSEGEIWVCGDHVALGYWHDSAAATFAARLANHPNRFLRTGDLGFKWHGELYITGRLKNLIIYRGVNLHPEDIESTIASCHPGFGPMGAAFSIEANNEEQVVVIYEITNNPTTEDLRVMIDRALDAAAQEHGVRLFDLAIMRAGTVPRTTSGKVQRDRCRMLYLSGELAETTYTFRHPSLGRYQAGLVCN
jgi:acyl-CoA synthetase (AMP-forming)/AMP-acid ligase II